VNGKSIWVAVSFGRVVHRFLSVGRAFEIIEVLIKSAGELVTKDELPSRIWPGAVVEENTLQVHISALRKALGADWGMLKTLSGRGYRLLGTWAEQHRSKPPGTGQPKRDLVHRRVVFIECTGNGWKKPRRVASFALIATTWLWGVHAMADGLVTLHSSFGPEETMTRFEAEVRARGMTVFAHIDHAAGAAAVGLPLRPTDLLIFGAAKAGTPLMQAAQTIGIDLPLKVLVWQAGATFLSYNDPAYLTHRHGLGEGTRPVVEAMSGALKAIAAKAITAP
jgi:uncharacterized protein (DUF302 family)